MKLIYLISLFSLLPFVINAQEIFTESELFAKFKEENSCWYYTEDKMVEESDKIINLIGKTNLVEVMEIIALSEGVISNDSGLMHVSASLDKKIIALFGSSSPTYTPPLISKEKRDIIYKNLDCSPCFKRVCPLGHTKCLNDIKVDEVKESVIKLFQ